MIGLYLTFKADLYLGEEINETTEINKLQSPSDSVPMLCVKLHRPLYYKLL
jgi:hypothetical protein